MVQLPDEDDIRVYYQMFGYHVAPDGRVVIESSSKCDNLVYDGKKYRCGIQGDKPRVCEHFPWEPRQIQEYCGFRFEDVRSKSKSP